MLRSLCLLLALSISACAPTKTNCNDGVDNDDDGRIDDDDPGCPFNQGNTENPNPPQCKDKVDNDDDGLIDENDWGCTDSNDEDEEDPLAACNNGLDDDGDGKIDWGSDLGCDDPVDDDEANSAACSDLNDNDNDAIIDYPFEPGCDSVIDDDESDPPEPPACFDGSDNDADDVVDYPVDPGCSSAADPDEFNTTVGECGPSVVIADITATGMGTGSITGPVPNELTSMECRGFGGEFAFVYNVTAANSALLVSTDYPETTLDTIVYVRRDCRDPVTELGCNDDVVMGNKKSVLTVPEIEPGPYYVIVDAFSPGSLGDFKVTVEERVGLGGSCDPAMPEPCVPGLICRELTPGAGFTCQYHLCGDMTDNDGDGDIDFPYDAGCTGVLDDDETDPSPVPACGNGADDDGDSFTDFPADMGCDFAADNSEIDECVPGQPVDDHPGGTVMGSTAAAASLLSAPSACDTSATSGTTPERVYVFNNQRNLSLLRFSTAGSSFDTMLYIRYAMCAVAGPTEYCNDNDPGGMAAESLVTIANPSMGNYFAIVDGSWSAVGDYMLTITGEIAPGNPCNAADVNFVCSTGFTCNGTMCVASQCNDGMDNDGDSRADAADAGCSDAADTTESPNPSPLPQCANGTDDDGDTLIDYPADLGCTRASDSAEQDCMDTDAVIDVSHMASYTGTTTGRTNDTSGVCISTYGASAPEVGHVFRVPGRTTVTISICGGASWDSVLYVKTDCATTAAASCDDDGCTGTTETKSVITGMTMMPGTYFIFVDGYFSGGAGDYTLSITGTVADGELCDPMQVVSGFLQCTAGRTCRDLGTGFRCQ